MSLVARLLILLGLALAPVFGAQLYTLHELRQEREAAARTETVRFARLVAGDLDRVIEGHHGILLAVSEAPFIRTLNLSECSEYLVRLARGYPEILNITLIDVNGKPVCASTPTPPTATAADRFYFQEALRQNAFVVGEYIIGRTVRQPQLPLALSFTDNQNQRWVLALGLGFDWLSEHFRDLPMPAGSSLWIADRNGTVITAIPDSQMVGKPLPSLLQPILKPGITGFQYSTDDGTGHIVKIDPIDAPPMGLIVAVDQEQPVGMATVQSASAREWAVLMVVTVLATGIAAFGTWHLVSRPLLRLTAAANAWSRGEYNIRTGIRGAESEVGQLAHAFDRMADAVQDNQRALRAMNETLEQRVAERTLELSHAYRRLETEMTERQTSESALRQAQKMDAIGQLTGGIAHDFNNLLTAISGGIDLLTRAVPAGDPRARRYATMARDSVERAARLTHRLLAFARQQPLEMQTLDVNRLIGEMIELLRRTIGEKISVETLLAEGLWLTRSDPVQLENTVLNLVINARDAMPGGGRLVIETSNVRIDDRSPALVSGAPFGDYVMLSVSDNGTGMPPEIVAKAFEPFFTTKPAGKGTGLGLSMIYGFVRQSGGHIQIESEVGHGTTVRIYLPRADGLAQPERADCAQASAHVPGGETILVVEDDEAVRELAVTYLKDLGYPVLSAADGDIALRLLMQRPDVALLVTDVVLGGMLDGPALAARAIQERPGLRVLYTTGYTANAMFKGGDVTVLPKPFTRESLTLKIQTVLG